MPRTTGSGTPAADCWTSIGPQRALRAARAGPLEVAVEAPPDRQGGDRKDHTDHTSDHTDPSKPKGRDERSVILVLPDHLRGTLQVRSARFANAARVGYSARHTRGHKLARTHPPRSAALTRWAPKPPESAKDYEESEGGADYPLASSRQQGLDPCLDESTIFRLGDRIARAMPPGRGDRL